MPTRKAAPSRRGELGRWLRSTKKGICPGCKQPLPKGARKGARLCRRPECPGRAKYLELYQHQRRGRPLLREIVSITPQAKRIGWVTVTLSCSHTFPQHRSKAGRGVRAKCPECKQ